MGRPLDGGPQVGLVHGAQQVQAPLDQAGEPGWADRSPSRSARNATTSGARSAWAARAAKNRACSSASSHRDDGLLALVDDERRCRSARGQDGQRVRRVGARGDHHHRAAVALEHGRHPGPHQQRLAAARRPHHRSTPTAPSAQAAGHVGVAAEERVGIGDVVGHETQVGAGGAGLGQRRLGDQ